MAVQRVILFGFFLFVVSLVNAAPKDEIKHTSLFSLAEGDFDKTPNEQSSRQATRKTTSKPLTTSEPITTKATTLKPVYIPPSSTVKSTTENISEKVMKQPETSKSDISREHIHAHQESKPDSAHGTKKIHETSVVEKKEHVKSKENSHHANIAYTVVQKPQQKEREVAEEKSALISSASLIPLLASIGTAFAIGGLAYYSYPVPEATARSDRFNHGHFNDGVRIVHPSDLTTQELRRLSNAQAYHVNARSNPDDKRPNDYSDAAQRIINYFTQYVAPIAAFFGGDSYDDTEDEYDIGNFQSEPSFVGDTNRLVQPTYNGGHQNVGPHIHGQPIVAQPNVAQHLLGQHNVGQPVGQPVFVQPGVGQQHIGQQHIGQQHAG